MVDAAAYQHSKTDSWYQDIQQDPLVPIGDRLRYSCRAAPDMFAGGHQSRWAATDSRFPSVMAVAPDR